MNFSQTTKAAILKHLISHVSFKVFLAGNSAGQGQLLNSAILTSMGQAQANGNVGQRIVAVGGKNAPVKMEPTDPPDVKCDGEWTSLSSFSDSEIGAAATDEDSHCSGEKRPEKIVIKQELEQNKPLGIFGFVISRSVSWFDRLHLIRMFLIFLIRPVQAVLNS